MSEFIISDFPVLQRRKQKTLASERPRHMAIHWELSRIHCPALPPSAFLFTILTCPCPSLTHRLRFLFLTGVHSNFSTTIPPTSWQADLPPHHPSSACSDGTLKLNTAASTEGTGVAGQESECRMDGDSVLTGELSHPLGQHALPLRLSVPSTLYLLQNSLNSLS